MDFYIPRAAAWFAAVVLAGFAIWPRLVYDDQAAGAYSGALLIGAIAMATAAAIVSRYLLPPTSAVPFREIGRRMLPVALLRVLALICFATAVAPIQLQSINYNEGTT